MPTADLSRRDLLFAATATTTALAQPPKPKRPNVLLILTDDQGAGDFSSANNPLLKTPTLDSLAQQSVRFTRFTVSPVCAPTRASLLTGRYHLRTGVWGVTAGRETMSTSEVTLGNAFQSAGYRTALVGKWHLGEHYPHVPHARGFDQFTGFRTGHWNRYFDPPLERNGQPFRTKGYIADILTDQAIAFLDQKSPDPFFLYLAYNPPHSPYIVSDEYWNRFEGKIDDPELRSIYAMVENLDSNIGRLLAHLDKTQLSNDTIVLFLCDNGPQSDRFNLNLRGRKSSVYEGGTRSPLWIRWPKQLEPHSVDRIAAHIDLYPTLLELCQVKAPAGPPIDGRSLVPLLKSTEAAATWPDRAIFSHQAGNRQAAPFPGSVRTQRWSLVNGKELYDLEADPSQRKEVSADHPAVVKDLRARYDAWFADVIKGCSFAAPRIP
ncbi:MAG: arylsulfatase, partial [Bryobacteraceae bacterium]|nr:arylsulfatase [Bryobacteraceae bacterium]